MTRIVSFKTDNFKRLEATAVELDSDNNFIEVTGRNAQGKSSLIDALISVFSGAEVKKNNSAIVRQGTDKAVVTVELDNGLTITRTFRSDNTFTLKVTHADGSTTRSPQKILDDLVGRLTFDPLAYMSMKPVEQYEILLGLMDLPFNLEEKDAERDGIFANRTIVNRDAKNLKAQLDAIPSPPKGLSLKPVSISELAEQFAAAQQVISENARSRQQHALKAATIDNMRSESIAIRDEMDELKARLSKLTTDIKREEKALGSIEINLADLEDPDTSAIQEQMASAEATNIKIAESEKYYFLSDKHDELVDIAEGLTKAIETIDKEKKDAITAAEFPVDGVGIDSDTKEVTYNGVPLSSCSGAERLIVSTSMGIATNPNLNVMFIKDGSLLDSDGRRALAEIANENDTQIWIERISETGETGIVIEGGVVANIEPHVGRDVLDYEPFDSSYDEDSEQW